MLITMVEGSVPQSKQQALEDAYRSFVERGLPAGALQTYLLRGAEEQKIWRIVTIWVSREALDTIRASDDGMPALRMFKAADVQPTLQLFDVVHTATNR